MINVNFHHTDEHPDRIGGMRLYDYYAAAAMQGLLAEYGNIQTSNAAAFELAQAAEIYASAMLTVRNIRMNELTEDVENARLDSGC